MSEIPRVALVIVTYNSADVLPGCLKTLAGGALGARLAAVVIADNASKDDSLAIAEAGVDDLPIRPLAIGRNSGYAAAINAGIATLDLDELDAVFVMNPDCRLHEGALAVLARSLREPGRGISVPRLINPDGSLQPSLRRQPTVRGAVLEAVLGGHLADRIAVGEFIFDPREYEKPCPAVWATGAAMMLSVPVIREVGPWDESFLLYSEETEFALRAAEKGWELWYEPSAVVEHIGGDSAVNPMLASMVSVNKVVLFRRRRGTLPAFVYYAAVTFGEAVRALAGRRASRAAFTALVRPSHRVRTLAS